MSIKERKYFFNEVTVNGNTELDYLNHNYTDMRLETDTNFRIPRAFRFRPDLISLKFYGNYHMGWLIAHHNDFLDPIFDFKEGYNLKIPNMDSYFRYFKTKTRRV